MDEGLKFLYRTVPGRMILKVLAGRTLSKLAGRFCDSSLSKPLIQPFVRKNQINLSECENTDFTCFNDCFTRQLKKELRPIDQDPEHLIAPCDGLLSISKIKENKVLPIKQSRYTLTDLLQNRKRAQEFRDGICLVFRLCVNHYHRYCYLDDGQKGKNHFISGKLHTVRPIALRKFPVFTENCREVTYMQTKNFGTVAQIEVGAMLVGKIQNDHGPGQIHRGEEKGRFLYGGSTIIVLLKKDQVRILPEITRKLQLMKEVPVKMGQAIGIKQR